MTEVWVDVPEFGGYYQVSNTGRVRSLPRTTLVRGIKRRDGHARNELWYRKGMEIKPMYDGVWFVRLYKEGQLRKRVSLSRLVSDCFGPAAAESAMQRLSALQSESNSTMNR